MTFHIGAKPGDIAETIIVGTLVIAVLAAFHKELVFSAFDPIGASAAGYRGVALDGVVLCAITVPRGIPSPSSVSSMS